MSKGWDNLTLKKLKTLVGKGLSTSEIGKRLGLSKNAVVGKLNRMGWNAKAGVATTSKAKSVKAKKTATSTTKNVKAKTPAKPQKKIVAKVPAKKSVAKPVTKKATDSEKIKKSVVATKTAKATAAPAKERKSTAKTSAKNLEMHQRIIQHSLEMANLKPNQCRWPIGDPDSEDFHFCGKTVFTGKPYCYEHCRLAYQFTPPKKKQ